MAANRQLEAFLAEEARGAAPAAAGTGPSGEPQTPAPAAPEPPQAAPEPKAAPTPPAESRATGTGPSGPEPAEDDGEPDDRLDHNGQTYIPRQVFDRERARRQDWKEQAVRNKERAEQLERQLQEAKRPPDPPPQPVYRQPPPDPAVDPQGYANYAWQQQVQAQLNHQLNVSEMLLREKVGDDKVSEYVAEFKELAQRDDTLFKKLYAQPHPYAWMQREVERQRVLRDVGDDPSAYRTRIEAEARAKWEAEAAARQPPAPVSPAAGLQPSLATARSVAGRTAPNWSGMTSEEDLVASIQNRKRSNGGAPRL